MTSSVYVPSHTAGRSARSRLVPVLTVWAVLSAVGAVRAEIVTGTIDARTKAGASRGTAIVYAEPLDGAAPRRPTTVRLEQKDKTFRPSVIVLPVGSTVEFPNLDAIFHNVFSLSRPEPFDLGLYRAGASKSRTFTQPGTYWVFCNIHPQMAAFLAVVPTPWATVADTKGTFRLELPRGRYRITALSDRAQPVTAEITVGAGTTPAPTLAVDETAWIGLSHKNKFNQDYPASAYEAGHH
ncbi:MAG: methylamine utilization protein [Vicinamibacterales bacterium]